MPAALLVAVIELTGKEREVMVLMIEGKRDAEIAAALGLKRRTVTNRILTVCDKLGAFNRAQAVAIFLEREGK